jgi:tetratricopeptide (TPR) repeat protein
MRLPLILALLVLSAPHSRADEAVPLSQGQTQATHPGPAPQLMHFERVLMRKQEARDKGELSPEKYQEFVSSFRLELDAVMGRIPPTPDNKGLHAQILARLGPQEQSRALAGLEDALADDPESPPLLVAKGSILYEQRDFQAADTLALQAWEASERKDQRAWALHKMSEGRISGAPSGEPAPQLRPASDFARLDWSIPERHDINDTALGLIKQATAARIKGEMAATERYVQAAMNADPTSKTLQEFYQDAKGNLSKHADTKAYLDQAVSAAKAGRRQEALVWMQKAYDRYPNDQAYEALQVARQRAAEEATKLAAEPVKSPARSGSGPLLPILLITGTGLFAYGGYQIAKSKNTRTSDDGVNPSPKVAPDQASRNYFKSAALAGTVLVALATLEFGGPLIAGARAFFATLGPSTSAGAGAGMGTATATAVTAEEAIKLGLPIAVGVYGAKKTAEDLYSNSSAQGQAGSSTAEPPRGESASPNAQDNLSRKLKALEKAQKDAVRVRKLEDGKIRYYGPEKPARTPGPTRGRVRVTEHDPKTGQVREWMETYDHSGQVNRVHPKMKDGQVLESQHYPPTGKELAP